jgi:prevent-host-death family protein
MEPARIGIRELRLSLSRAIQRVRRGETLEVTDRGRPVARIVPVLPVAGLNELISTGVLHPARADGPLPAPLDLPSTMSSEEAIDRLRGG